MVDKTSLVKNAKSFWDSKEGTTGMVIGAGILGLIGYGAYQIMPYIANLMENTVYAIGFGRLRVYHRRYASQSHVVDLQTADARTHVSDHLV
jgi:hypothetical protein